MGKKGENAAPEPAGLLTSHAGTYYFSASHSIVPMIHQV